VTDRAIVIGCDGYPHLGGGADLSGAVADALAMYEWLTRSAGTIAPSDVILLVTPSDGGAIPEAGTVAGEASRAELVSRLAALSQEPATRDDRFIFFMAGHGCRTDPDNEALSRDTLAFSDFRAHDPGTGVVDVDNLVTFLKTLAFGELFGELFLLLDACRNLPYDRPFDPARIGFDPAPTSRRDYEPRLFKFQATLAGATARGEQVDGKMRGLFTAALLRGLNGAGRAKVFNEQSTPARYEVRWSTLAEYVAGALAEQEPRALGEGGDPLLAAFPDGSFPDVRLEVDVQPDAAGASPELEVEFHHLDSRGPAYGRDRHVGPAPVVTQVTPRNHQIWARAPGFEWTQKGAGVYIDPAAETVRLTPATGLSAACRGNRGSGTVVRVRTNDPAAVIELRDANASLVVRGVGEVRSEQRRRAVGTPRPRSSRRPGPSARSSWPTGRRTSRSRCRTRWTRRVTRGMSSEPGGPPKSRPSR
jgi:caspase domain-containing protein